MLKAALVTFLVASILVGMAVIWDCQSSNWNSNDARVFVADVKNNIHAFNDLKLN